MPTAYVVTSKDNPRVQYDNVTVTDTVQYSVDFTPWQDDNDAITGVTWAIESGQAGLGATTFNAGVSTALISFPQAGRSLISAVALTATRSKKIWLNVVAHDELNSIYDDGYFTNGLGP